MALLFVLLIAAEGTVFYKHSFRHFDKSALAFLLMITLCLGAKSAVLFLKAARQGDSEQGIEFPPLDIASMATDLAYWILLNFFVIEMKTVKDYILAASTEDFNYRFSTTLKLRRVVLPSQFFCSSIFRLIVCFKIYQLSFY